MKHKITQTLDLALLPSGEPDQSESQNNTEAKLVCWMIGTKPEFQELIPSNNVAPRPALNNSAVPMVDSYDAYDSSRIEKPKIMVRNYFRISKNSMHFLE